MTTTAPNGGYTAGINVESKSDFQTQHITIRNNVIWDITAGIGDGIRVGFHQYPHPVYEVEIVHNTIYNVSTNGILLGTGEPIATVHTAIVKNNIVSTAGDTAIEFANTSGSDGERNCVWDAPQLLYPISLAPSNLGTDPKFIAPNNADFHLQPNSLCIDAGLNMGVTIDIEGIPRPYGGGFDIGAYEALSTTKLLAIYALAFDIPLTATHSLALLYPGTIKGIKQATKDSNSIAIVLADMQGDSDTHIKVFQNGQLVEFITNLPNANGTVTLPLHEYDMTSGVDLGGFLKWALDSSYNTTNSRITFSYIGHGAPVVPNADLSPIFDQATGRMSALTFSAIPMPSHVGLHANYTDYHPQKGIISPGALAIALDIATNGGQNPIAVLDLVHCFAASIEEFYELAPYADTLTGSPNYTYFSPKMAGHALQAMSAAVTSQAMATAAIDAYHNDLPSVEHPHLLVAVDSSEVAGIKDSWDAVSGYLLNGFDATTHAKLFAAYQSSLKYDTTFCDPQDWELDCPDALVDLADFAQALSLEFGPLSDVGIHAQTTALRVEDAIIASRSASDQPWFADVAPKPFWNFDDHVGLGLYADLEGMTFADDPGVTYLSWQAHWYTGTTYLFTEDTLWDEVFNRYWQGQTVETAFCLPYLLPVQRPGEVGVERVVFPLQGSVSQSTPVQLSVAITTAYIALNPQVQFTVTLNGNVVFSDTVGTGYLVTGTHQVDASHTWMPDATGAFELTVTINGDGRITGDDPQNNTITMNDRAWPLGPPRPIISASVSGGLQWVVSNEAHLDIVQDTATMPAAGTVVIQVYQYSSSADPNASLPALIDTQTFNSITLPLSDWPVTLPLTPGPVVLHIWAWSTGGLSVAPTIVEFNYAPPDTPISIGEAHYYLFRASQGDSVQIDLAVSAGQDANLFAWDPLSYGFSTWQSTNVGSDTLAFAATFSGQYVLQVYGETDATYTLNVGHNASADQRMAASGSQGADNPLAYVPAIRPIFVAPVPQAPKEYNVFLPAVIRRQ